MKKEDIRFVLVKALMQFINKETIVEHNGKKYSILIVERDD